MDSVYELVLIGAGVSNISCAYFLHMHQYSNFLIIEMGGDIIGRNRDSATDCVAGIGGCGLFSDGKFSYYNSGTDIWKLEKDKLKSSYQFFKEQIMAQYKVIPDFPDHIDEQPLPKEDWTFKSYRSDYLTLEQRMDMIVKITSGYRDKFKLDTEVTDIVKKKRNSDVYYLIKCRDNIGNITKVRAKRIILGGGRFMPLFISKLNFIPMIFKRIEVGIRLQGPSDNKLFNPCSNLDPKFIKYDPSKKIEYRTFCWCRGGEVVQTYFKGIRTWSGRADCSIKSLSNFGFNIRFKDEGYLYLLDSILKTEPFTLNISEINKLKEIDAEIYVHLLEGLKSFVQFSGISFEEILNFDILGFTVEGVGKYPVTDSNLKVIGENIWVTGDATGKFRGIVASMLSGIFVAHQLLNF
jgi:uncharacterized FAD-dependent dehydrogenase